MDIAVPATMVLAVVLVLGVSRSRTLPHWVAVLLLVLALAAQYLAVWRWSGGHP